MAFAFANVGLPGAAFLGGDWAKIHARKLQETCSSLLMMEQKPQTILLCGVGNVSDPITPEGRERLEEVLKFAFKETGAEGHGPPQCVWITDATMIASRAGGQMHLWKHAVTDHIHGVIARTITEATALNRLDNNDQRHHRQRTPRRKSDHILEHVRRKDRANTDSGC